MTDTHAPTETTMHPYGSYRRRIRLVNEPGLVRGGLEDDFHYFRVAVRHDGSVVTDIEVEAFRWPWTTCPDAGNELQQLVGMPLSPRCLAVGDHANPRLQCTHQFDLTGLAVAHATRDEHARQYDAEILLLHVVNPVYVIPETGISASAILSAPEWILTTQRKKMEEFAASELRDFRVRRLVLLCYKQNNFV